MPADLPLACDKNLGDHEGTATNNDSERLCSLKQSSEVAAQLAKNPHIAH